jgi:FkbM family methyltransferase
MSKMISYAQNCEDVLLRRIFPDLTHGFYIDVGANDPVSHSVTKHFYDRGWHGINIEPIPIVYEALCAQRERDINLNLGVSNREGFLTFYGAPSVPCWSVSQDVLRGNFGIDPAQIVARDVPVSTLEAICEQHADRTIDFLKIDAEDHEREVLEGANWERWRPRVVVAEGWQRSWEPILIAAKYLHATFDGVNHYYIREEDRQLLPRLAAPVNVTDNFVQYEYVDIIERLQADLHEARAEIKALRVAFSSIEDLGPTALRVARRLSLTARRYPKVTSLVRPVFRYVS